MHERNCKSIFDLGVIVMKFLNAKIQTFLLKYSRFCNLKVIQYIILASFKGALFCYIICKLRSIKIIY